MLNAIDTTQAEIPSSLAKVKPEETRRMKIWLDEKIAAGRKKALAEVVTLTPVLASLLLDRNKNNRPLSRRGISALEQDARNSRIVFNGASIVVSDQGNLNDGQHRCLTVLDTGISIETVIVFGAKEETRFTVDTGKPKSVSNFLAMKGRKYTHALGPAINYIIQYREHGTVFHGDENKPSTAAILAAADEIRGIDSSIDFTSGSMKTTKSHAVLAFCHFMFWKKTNREAADQFITKLIEGDNLRKGDPILYCRNRFLGIRSQKQQVRPASKIELIFKCWNAWRLNLGVDHCKLTGNIPKIER